MSNSRASNEYQISVIGPSLNPVPSSKLKIQIQQFTYLFFIFLVRTVPAASATSGVRLKRSFIIIFSSLLKLVS